jgi:hypothetical protein
MDVTTLVRWRDAALIVLVVQAVALGIFAAAGLYRGLRALAPLEGRVRPILFDTRMAMWRVQRVTQRAMRALAGACVWLQSAAQGLHRVLDHLGWRYR